MTYDEADGHYVVRAVTENGEETEHRAPHLVLGTGIPPYVPEACRDLGGDLVHNTGYLDAKAAVLAGSLPQGRSCQRRHP
ncbi:lysine N6-hydroxylase [Microbispora rosea]|uniref:L-lysine N6-monooxygenase MbtG n=1 Tax=Microbispora rosea TaxID=58117 RepID=A0A1N7DMB2_9ACTN|nr:hypothetical protein Mro03_45330 [Microbispora rosea subsp. rosea]SIR76835.1 lysine N6-hydroxylase [Microbispora rosea]